MSSRNGATGRALRIARWVGVCCTSNTTPPRESAVTRSRLSSCAGSVAVGKRRTECAEPSTATAVALLLSCAKRTDATLSHSTCCKSVDEGLGAVVSAATRAPRSRALCSGPRRGSGRTGVALAPPLSRSSSAAHRCDDDSEKRDGETRLAATVSTSGSMAASRGRRSCCWREGGFCELRCRVADGRCLSPEAVSGATHALRCLWHE
eukprot:102633-Prymnesium_polylepis.1